MASATAASSLRYEYDEMFGDGVKNKFDLRYNGVYDTAVTHPASVIVTVNGLVQQGFVNNADTVWQSMVLAANRGYTVVVNSTASSIKFSVTPAGGAIVAAKYLGLTTSQSNKTVPFKALDVLMGY